MLSIHLLHVQPATILCLLSFCVLSAAEMSPTGRCEEEREAALELVPWQLF